MLCCSDDTPIPVYLKIPVILFKLNRSGVEVKKIDLKYFSLKVDTVFNEVNCKESSV